MSISLKSFNVSAAAGRVWEGLSHARFNQGGWEADSRRRCTAAPAAVPGLEGARNPRSSTPPVTPQNARLHTLLRPREWWEALFARHGAAPNRALVWALQEKDTRWVPPGPGLLVLGLGLCVMTLAARQHHC